MPLFESPAVLRQLADKFPFGLYLADPQRKILFWNLAAEQITGYYRQEVVGRSCASDLLVHCSTDGMPVCQSDGCPLRSALRENRPAESHLYLRHKQGQRIPVRTLSLPMLNEHGAIVAVAELFVEENASPEGLCWITPTSFRLDPQLGIPSVLATHEQLSLTLPQAPPDLAAFLIEIQDLQDMRMNRGVELVETALRAVVQTVRGLLTVPHYLGCWTEHRLLVLVPHCSEEFANQLPAKLQALVRTCGLMWWGDHVLLNVKATPSFVRPEDSVEQLMARIEQKRDDSAQEDCGCSS